MEAYKCDYCGNFYEDNPANKGMHQYIQHEQFRGIALSARVDTGVKIDLDVCPKCLISGLRCFIRSYEEDYPLDRKEEKLERSRPIRKAV